MAGSFFTLGIDFGTSGARAIAIDEAAQPQAQASVALTEQTAEAWRIALYDLLAQLPLTIRQQVRAIAINGTSSTVLLCDPQGVPIREPLLYNDDRGAAVLGILEQLAPPQHPVLSATSSLAKLMWWICQQAIDSPGVKQQESARPYFLHQADWLGFLLHGQLGVSDYHNALKLGYDVELLRYPDWMAHVPPAFQLPQVVTPGQAIAPVTAAIATQFHLPPTCTVHAGTTDSIAAFLASGASQPGDAVTSLGSTLVIKLLSKTRVDDSRYGLYSHRLGDLWLVGGASNTGGAVLRQFFRDEELQRYSDRIDPHTSSPYQYYPLLKPGERFPINDPHLLPVLTPQPDDPVLFLHGLLEGIARIEAQGYDLLQRLGASPVTRIYTAGGGAHNPTWTLLRSRMLPAPVLPAPHTEAAYGSALLAHMNS
ncbi:FGGY-family carbohydrate kinase [Leptolyngbya sp. AN02str]